jgi:hypothetical protein
MASQRTTAIGSTGAFLNAVRAVALRRNLKDKPLPLRMIDVTILDPAHQRASLC